MVFSLSLAWLPPPQPLLVEPGHDLKDCSEPSFGLFRVLGFRVLGGSVRFLHVIWLEVRRSLRCFRVVKRIGLSTGSKKVVYYILGVLFQRYLRTQEA